jgi:hypothetical protein
MEKNPEYAKRQKENCDKWHEINVEKSKQYKRQYNRRQETMSRRYRSHRAARLARFGLNESSALELLNYQGDKCAICLCEFNEPPQLDHCHETMAARGFLCGKCNKALGLLCDNKETLIRALEYLENPPLSQIATNEADST